MRVPYACVLNLREEAQWLLARALDFLSTDRRAARRKAEPGLMACAV